MIKQVKLQPLISVSHQTILGYEILYDLDDNKKYPSVVWLLENVYSNIQNKDTMLFFNLSLEDVLEKSFCEKFLNVIHKLNIAPNNIVLEVSEMMPPTYLLKAHSMLSELKKYGISVALDDFGTEYSTLSFLNELPIDIVKVDRKFIFKALTNKKTMSILSNTIRLAHDIDCKVVIEGIETQDQFDFAKQIGADIVQGFYFVSTKNGPFIRYSLDSQFANNCNDFNSTVNTIAVLKS